MMKTANLLNYFKLTSKIGLWGDFIKKELYETEFKLLLQDLLQLYATGSLLLCPRYPVQVFRAFRDTPLEKVKVVILGQDPYPNQRQADGLAFSSGDETGPLPKSLLNIKQELVKEGLLEKENEGKSLHRWAAQGVLLLNTCLTSEEGAAGVHRGQEGRTRLGTSANMESEYGYGWEHFIFNSLRHLLKHRPDIIFLALGKDAKNLCEQLGVDETKLISAAHPSPLSAHRGFFGSECFLKVNELLEANGRSPIEWRI